MKIWRPRDRPEWWFMFLGATLLLPIVVYIASGVLGSLFHSSFHAAGLLAMPLAGCYLIAVSHLPVIARALLLPVYFALVATGCQPRTSCEEPEPVATSTAAIQSDNPHGGCSG